MVSGDPSISSTAADAAGQGDLTETGKLGINLSAGLEELTEGGGNTAFEELTCVGLNTPTDPFGAIIHVKRPGGYAGDLCSAGSQEYVAFWAGWDGDGVFEAYIGTASVGVHDSSTIPAGGLYYSVLLPAAVGDHLQACSAPNVINLRAVLSWAVPPSTVDPDAIPFWGNPLDALIHVRPGQGTGTHQLLSDSDGAPPSGIDTTQLQANPSIRL